MLCQTDGIGHGRIVQRDERQHVQRADAGMHPGVRAQVDAFQRDGGQSDGGFTQLLVTAGQREDAAVVNRVARAVQQARAGRFGGGDAGVDDGEIAAFADVRDGF